MKLKKKYLTILMFVLVVCFMGVNANAASSYSGKVTKLTAKAASETSLKLSWKKAANASGYIIYRVDTKTGTATKLATTNKLTYTVKNLIPEKKYSFRVTAYSKIKKVSYESDIPSNVVTAKTTVKKPGKPSGLKVTSYGTNQTVNLKWNRSSNAAGYYIYMYDPAVKKYSCIGTTSKNKFTTGKLTAGTTYNFKIIAYRTVKGVTVQGASSKEVTVKAKSFSAAVASVHSRHYNVKFKKTVNVQIVGSSQKKNVKAGTSGVAEACGGNYVVVQLSGGVRVRVKIENLKYVSLNVTKTPYSTKTKEAFVNERGYSSNTKYLIWVSQYTLNTNIFYGYKGHWKLVRSMPCVIGKWGSMTPQGEFKTCRQDIEFGGARIWFTYDAVEGDGNSFHRRVDGHKQSASSHGCVRLADEDLMYIVRNCPMGTKVVCY